MHFRVQDYSILDFRRFFFVLTFANRAALQVGQLDCCPKELMCNLTKGIFMSPRHGSVWFILFHIATMDIHEGMQKNRRAEILSKSVSFYDLHTRLFPTRAAAVGLASGLTV